MVARGEGSTRSGHFQWPSENLGRRTSYNRFVMRRCLLVLACLAELWSAALPLHGTAPPATYEAKGRQFIVLPATGGGKLGGPSGDAWVAFALPE